MRALESLLVAVAIVTALALAGHDWLWRPVLFQSITTRLCVAVDDPSGRHSCANPPATYHHVWVR